MADADEVFGKHVEQKTTDEFNGVEGQRFLAAGLGVIADHESDAAVMKGSESSVGDGDSVGISAEISKHRLGSAEGGFCVDHPILVVEGVHELLPRTRLGKGLGIAFENEIVIASVLGKGAEKLASKQLGEDFDRKKVSLSCGNPFCPVRAETAAGDHAVEVGMELEVLSPCVEHGGETDVRTEVLGISSDLFQDSGGGVEKERHGETHVAAEKWFQLCGEGEDHMEIRHGE
jgi:hypothetical protein